MRITRPGVAAVVALLGSVVCVSATDAAETMPVGKTFGPRRSLTGADLVRRPVALSPARSVKVVVVVAGPSVAEAEGDALDRNTGFTQADEAAVRAAAATAQNGVLAQVQARGGRVERRLQDAINAVTVVVPANQVDGLRDVPGVVSVTPVRLLRRTNATSNAFTGVPAVWNDVGLTGKGVTIAVIDDGVDYTHADFGGPGTPEAYTDNDRTTLEPGTFPTAKVIGGRDFVGDAYDADSDDPAIATPRPDPDPLGCGGHGTHVAGTAAGNGVLADGTAYAGPYTDAALAGATFDVAPGSAPEAPILAYQVFGCEGSVTDDIVLAAVDRAVADGADVINLSLGSPWGRADTAEARAIDNSVRAGVVVVASAGNEGGHAYMAGAPSTAKRALSVAALDAIESFAGAAINGVAAINANAAPLPVTGTVKVLRTATGEVSLGCDESEYAGAAGAIVVTVRGTCDRVARAEFGQQNGAAAVVMINNSEGFPPFEGNIPGVTIPFLGVETRSRDVLDALDGQSATVTSRGIIANPAFKEPADFSSGGPRFGDSGQKPDVIAPGVSVASAALGTGSEAANMSGTSMSSPHTAGIAALVVQAHPEWRAEFVKAALVNTADPAKLANYDSRVAGSGVVDPAAAVATTAVALAGDGEASINFTFAQLRGDFDLTRKLFLVNRGAGPTTFDLAAAFGGDALGAEVSVSPTSITVPPGGRSDVTVRLRMSAAAAAALPAADQGFDVTTIRGVVTATPASGGPALRVPFIFTPLGLSDVQAEHVGQQLQLHNGGLHAGDADVYAWLLQDRVDRGAAADLRAVGAQVFDAPPDLSDVPDDKLVVFGLSLHSRFSAAGAAEYDVVVDRDGDGEPDVIVFAADEGLVLAGAPNGILASFTFDLASEDLTELSAIAPSNGSSVLVAALASDLGLDASSPKFSFSVFTATVVDRGSDDDTAVATFDAWDPQLSQGDFVSLAPGESASVPVTQRPPKPGERPALGWLVITFDDAAGDAEGDVAQI